MDEEREREMVKKEYRVRWTGSLTLAFFHPREAKTTMVQ